MEKDYRWLKLRQLDQRLQAWRTAADKAPPPKEGWLRALRHTIGMTTGQMARRLGTRQPWVLQLEQAELKGSVTLASLRKAGQAMDCELVYALVPRGTLESRVRTRAASIAAAEIASVAHSMALEKQRTRKSVETQQSKALRERLLAGSWRRLWR